MISMDFTDKIEEFKTDLQTHSASEIVQKRIIFGECAVLTADQYLSLRIKVADFFKIHPNEILVVGSAKLGFSIAPLKRYRLFGDNSDIDIVIVSSRLFDDIWRNVFELWKQKIMWDREETFKDYLFQGWVRPDKLPNSNLYPLTKDWWEFFRKLTSSSEFGPYKIAGALYKDWSYLESYQNSAAQDCKNELKGQI